MKRIIIIILSALAIIAAAYPLPAHCEYESGQSDIEEELEDILADYDIDWSYGDISGLTFSELRERITESVRERISAPVRLLGILITVILFTSFIQGLSSGVLKDKGQICDMICIMTAVTAITPGLFAVYENALGSVERVSSFMLVFVPVFAGITIAAGGAVTGTTYDILILGASGTFAAAAESFFMPLLSVNAVLAVSGSVFPDHSLDGVINILKKTVTWGLTVFMTLFTGFAGLRSTLAAKTDGAGAKALKYVISGFVPIVGGAVSDAYSTVKGSFELIGSTVGTAGCLAIAVIMLPPIIELLSFRIVMWIGNAVAELFSSSALVKLLKGIDGGLAIAQSVLVCYSVMLIICTAIVVQNI